MVTAIFLTEFSGVYATDGVNALQTITAAPEHADMSVEVKLQTL